MIRSAAFLVVVSAALVAGCSGDEQTSGEEGQAGNGQTASGGRTGGGTVEGGETTMSAGGGQLTRVTPDQVVYAGGTTFVSPLVERFGDVYIGEGSFIAGNTILRVAPERRGEPAAGPFGRGTDGPGRGSRDPGPARRWRALAVSGPAQIREYEERNKSRDALIEQTERKIKASS